MIYFHNPNTRSDRYPNVAPMNATHVGPVCIQKYAPHDAYAGRHTFAIKGGMCNAVTGGNMGAIPQAFQRVIYS